MPAKKSKNKSAFFCRRRKGSNDASTISQEERSLSIRGGGDRIPGADSRRQRRQSEDRNRCSQGSGSEPPRSLRSHQEAALVWGRWRDAVAFMLDMRLGKTLLTIRWAMEKGDATKKLVVAPSTVLRSWAAELSLEGIPYTILEGTTKKKIKALDSTPDEHWVLINPDGLRAAYEIVLHGWDMVILDESTAIKNPKSQIAKLFHRVLSRVKYRAILTGHAAPEGLEDIYEQMAFVLGGGFMGCSTFWKWRVKYMEPENYSWVVKEDKRSYIECAFRDEAFCLTTKQAGYFVNHVHEKLYVDLSKKEKTVYDAIEKKWELPSGETTKTSLAALTWMRQFAAGATPGKDPPFGFIPFKKHQLIAELCSNELKNDSIVVWTNFVDEMIGVWTAIYKATLSTVGCICAETSTVDRQNIINSFQTKKTRIIVITESIGKYGINLSTGTAMIYASNAWDYESRLQSMRRCDAIGKDRPTLIIDCITTGTIEEEMLEVLSEKNANAQDFSRTVMTKLMKRGVKVQ